tara:strand:- start:884 stop:1537 length:654 start_codon:yes stop_codon:yes gene_type:complete
MAISTYTELKTEIADHLNRTDLTSQIPNFIVLAEAMHKRDVRIREMITRISDDVDARYVALPAGFLEGISMRILYTGGGVKTIDYLSPEEMTRQREKYQSRFPTAPAPLEPYYYTIEEQIEFDSDPTADGALVVDFEMRYYKAFTALSAAAPTNGLLTRSPDIYLYSALTAASPYLLNDQRIAVWGGLATNAINAINLMDRKRSASSLVAKVVGSTP